jgi:hypothetical protein
VRESPRLQGAYNHRWWHPHSNSAYFTFHCTHPCAEGQQLLFSYGDLSNAHLLENYGFSLTHQNPFDSVSLRLMKPASFTKKVLGRAFTGEAKQLLPKLAPAGYAVDESLTVLV